MWKRIVDTLRVLFGRAKAVTLLDAAKLEVIAKDVEATIPQKIAELKDRL